MLEKVKYIHGGKFISRGEWRHPDRVIDSTELILVTKGSVAIVSGGVAYRLTPGDILRLDPGVRHFGSESTSDPVAFYWFHFSGANPAELPLVYLPSGGSAQTELLCRQLLHYENTVGFPKEATDWLLKVLLTELSTASSEKESGDTLTAAITEWVRANADLPLRVSDVAKHFRYNEDYLNRLFRRHHPEGLKAYINDTRVARIRKDLTADETPLRELAAKYGFRDYKYFLKYFKYHVGVAPTAYRAAYARKHINHA